MADLIKLRKNLERGGFQTSCFSTVEECCCYMNQQLDGVTIGFGGSQTVRDMALYEQLETHNSCYWHWDKTKAPEEAIRWEATQAQVYICSSNAVTENGELVNIDGGGNRLASILYGHKKVYFIVGINKITPDLDTALQRVRNIAAPLNAQRLGKNTPCARVGHCCNCNSPDRICSALLIHWNKPALSGQIEIVIVEQDLGF